MTRHNIKRYVIGPIYLKFFQNAGNRSLFLILRMKIATQTKQELQIT